MTPIHEPTERTLSQRLDRMESDHQRMSTLVTEIHAAILGSLERPGGLAARVAAAESRHVAHEQACDARHLSHEAKFAALDQREVRRTGWVATAVIGWVVALFVAGISWIRDHAK